MSTAGRINDTSPARTRSPAHDGTVRHSRSASELGPPRARLSNILVTTGLFVALVAAPFSISSFTVLLLAEVLILGLLAASLDLLVGYTGLPSLGHAAFYGTGGYVAGVIAIDVTPNVFVQLGAACCAGLVSAAVVGALAVRAHGIRFLMLTVAFAQIAFTVALTWDGTTGGSNGLFGIPYPSLLNETTGVMELEAYVFWYVLAVVAVGYLALRRVASSHFGQTLKGIRHNERRMSALGYGTYWDKLLAYTIAGGVAAVAGSLTVASQQFLSPADMGFEVSVLALMMVIVGGSGTVWGAFLGAAIVIAVREVAADILPGQGHLILGLLFVIVVFAFPRGLAGGLNRTKKHT